LLVGFGGIIISTAILFVPVSWVTGFGVSNTFASIEYLFGNSTAEPIFMRAMFLLLLSLFIIYVVITEGIRVFWIIVGLMGIWSYGALSYQGNTGKILLSVTVLLAISATFITISRRNSPGI
jgi:hypothetical protein